MNTSSKPLDAAAERLAGLLLDIAKPCQRAADAVLRTRTAALTYPADAGRRLAALMDELSDQAQSVHDELVTNFGVIAENIASVEAALLKGSKSK